MDDLLRQERFEEAYNMIKDQTENSNDFLYQKSLLCRLFDDYERERQVLDLAFSLPLDDKKYFEERLNWHNLSPFEQREPRQELKPKRTRRINEEIIERLCIITASNDAYFETLTELIESLRNTKLYKDVPLFVMDFGLNDVQKNYLHEKFPKNFDIRKVHGRFSNIYDSRCELNKYFPGYQYYFYIDSDIWIQDEEQLDDYLFLCTEQGIGGSEEWINDKRFPLPPPQDEWQSKYAAPTYFSNSRFFLPEDLNDPYLYKTPYFNAGCIAIDNNTDVFERYQNKMLKLYDYGGARGIDMAAILAVACNKRISKVLDASHMLMFKICEVMDPNCLQVDEHDHIWFNSGGVRNIGGLVHLVGHKKTWRDGDYLYQYTLPTLDTHVPRKTSVRYRVLPWKDKPTIKTTLVNL